MKVTQDLNLWKEPSGALRRVAIAALLASVFSLTVHPTSRHSAQSSDPGRVPGANCPKAMRELTLKTVSIGELQDGNAHLGFSALAASDGVDIMHFYAGFVGPDEAKKYLLLVVARARRIVAQGEKQNERGEVVGLRAVLSLPNADDVAKEHWAIVWTDGRDFEEFSSNSLCHALEMERTFYPPGSGGADPLVQTAARNITLEEARSLALIALSPEGAKPRELGLNISKDRDFPAFYFFDGQFDSKEHETAVTAHYAVDRETGDVWSAVVCKEYKTTRLRDLQFAVRKQIGVSPEQYRRLRRPGPVCGPNDKLQYDP